MFVVTGATGKTGSVVAATLAERRQKLRVVVRDATKGAVFKQRGAEVAVAPLDNVEALTEALRGAEGLYVMIPPLDRSNESTKSKYRIVDAFARAIEATRPRHVVLLSSIGADLPSGTGPVTALYYAEEKLGRLPTALTALRAAYFVENWHGMLPVARAKSILPSMLDLERRHAMVTTADVGRVAAEALLEGPGAKRLIELAGPTDYSPLDVAATLSKLLDRPIRAVRMPDEEIIPTLESAGFSEDMAGLFREMTVGFNQGKFKWTTKTQVRGQVPLEVTLRQLLGQ
jgi:NAD(P)H dehydrogenase (quinone)